MTQQAPTADGTPTLRISHDARFVVAPGRRSELSPAESALLSCLMAHAGEPVSRARLLFALRSGSKGKPLPERAVDFAIRRLRLKVEPDPSKPQVLFTVRGRGYRFVAPPETEARARAVGPASDVARTLAAVLRQPGRLVHVLGGSAPARGGLMRSAIDVCGGPPVGGVLWVSGRFCDPDDLMLALAVACGPGMPLDQTLDHALAARARTLIVVDGLATEDSALLARMRQWRQGAPQHTWVVSSTRPMALDEDIRHDLGPTTDPSTAIARIQACSAPARQVLAQLLASPGPVDVDLLTESNRDAVLAELDVLGVVRSSGRSPARRATLITGAPATVAAALPTRDQREGALRARQLVATLVPEYSPQRPWNLLLPDAAVRTRAVRHHPLLMAAIEAAIRTPRTRDLQVAVSALALMCGTLPRALMGSWLRSRGRRLLHAGRPLPRLQAMVHLALAWLEVPVPHPALIGSGRTDDAPRRDSPGAADPDSARHHLEEARRIAEYRGFDRVVATAHTLSARVHAAEGDTGAARKVAKEAWLQHQASTDPVGLAATALTLAGIADRTEQPTACGLWLADAVPRLETSGRHTWAARARTALGRRKIAEGDDLAGRFHLDAALVVGRSAQDLRIVAVAADLLAELEERAGRTGEAVLRRREARRARERLGDPRFATATRSRVRAGQTG